MGETLLSRGGILSTPVFTDVQDFRLRRLINQLLAGPLHPTCISPKTLGLFVGRFLRPKLGVTNGETQNHVPRYVHIVVCTFIILRFN